MPESFTLSSCIAFLLFYTLITSCYPGADRSGTLGPGQSVFNAPCCRRGLKRSKMTAVIEAQAAGVKKVFFRFLSLNGQVFSSSNMSYWKDIDIHETAIKELLRGRNHVFETITIPQRKEKVRILYAMLSPTHHFAGGAGHGELSPDFSMPLKESSSSP